MIQSDGKKLVQAARNQMNKKSEKLECFIELYWISNLILKMDSIQFKLNLYMYIFLL